MATQFRASGPCKCGSCSASEPRVGVSRREVAEMAKGELARRSQTAPSPPADALAKAIGNTADAQTQRVREHLSSGQRSIGPIPVEAPSVRVPSPSFKGKKQ